MESQEQQGLTIWSFLGFIFIIYGLAITGAGIYYIFYPHVSTALYALNPSLWWGAIMLLVGLVFTVGDRKYRKKQAKKHEQN